jgi:hypothetical protein
MSWQPKKKAGVSAGRGVLHIANGTYTVRFWQSNHKAAPSLMKRAAFSVGLAERRYPDGVAN